MSQSKDSTPFLNDKQYLLSLVSNDLTKDNSSLTKAEYMVSTNPDDKHWRKQLTYWRSQTSNKKNSLEELIKLNK